MGQSTPLSKPVVLVVDDEPMLRMLAVDILEEAGYRVLEADCAQEAIRVLENRNDVLILLTDVNMPGQTDGAGLARCVAERWPGTQIVVTSGKMCATDLRLPTRSQFMPKPYRDSDLLHLLSTLHS